jgi:hypothetical protein
MRQILAALALLMTSTAAFAQFKPTHGVDDNGWGSGLFECGIVLFPHDNDRDPIYKINVNLSFDGTGVGQELRGITVAHTSVTGKIYERSDQYSSDAVDVVDGKLEAHWRGRWTKNNSVIMRGRIWNERSDGKWYYTENAPQMRLLSICHLLSGSENAQR